MSLLSRTLTRVVSSSLHHSIAAKLPTQKYAVSTQIRFYTAALNNKIDGGGKNPGAKPPISPPDVAPVIAAEKKSSPPKKIEFSPEIANWINLIGFVDQPVQFQSYSNGNFWAGTVISQRSGVKSSSFWIPIIFEGDLAKTAANHVKKDDRIRIYGKLFIDSPPPNVTFAQSNVQIMVQKLNFVEATISPPENEEISTKKKRSRSKKVKVMDEETSNSWKHLLENPKDWLDHRGNKASGLVKPRHPDFKRKKGSHSLWLNQAPDWALPKLEGLQFDVFVPKVKLKQLTGEESWKDLVQNPNNWLDNRSNKTVAKAPDFKHKETGEELWMTDSPIWVLSKLPPLKKNQEGPPIASSVSQPTLKQPKREEFWKDLVENPDKWWDNRLSKTIAKAPDFKHKETNEVLWMTNAPAWVLSKLPPLKESQEGPLMANTVSGSIQKQLKREELWKDLAQDPDKWWDNRLDKRNVKGPDFKHKETGDVLWMSDSPAWVLSKLPPLKKNQERHVMA